MIVTLKLDPARIRLLAGFVDSYLKLTSDESEIHINEIAKFTPEEREATMEIMTSWEEQRFNRGPSQGLNEAVSLGRNEGLSVGLVQGMEKVIARQIRHSFGALSQDVFDRLDQLSTEQQDVLAESLLDFENSSDVVDWLSRH